MKTRYYMIKPQIFPKWSKMYVYKPKKGMVLNEYDIPRIKWGTVSSYDFAKFVPNERIENLLVTSYNYRNNIGEYWT